MKTIMSSNLENEDLDNVPLVRMEDVQPSRERVVDSQSSSIDDEEVYEACIIDDIECENECIVNDDEDSNIGSMVSLHSEDVYEDDSSSQELIIPEVLEEIEAGNNAELGIYVGKQEKSEHVYLADDIETCSESKQEVFEAAYIDVAQDDVEEQIDAHLEAANKLKSNTRQYGAPKSLKLLQESIEVEVPPNKIKIEEDITVKPPSESWPTLEILPGGVIKNTDKYESDSYLYPDKIQETVGNSGDMMYACAKCSQTFKYLFCLVKHVKWHEDQKKGMKDTQMGKMSAVEGELLNLKREGNELDRIYKKKKLEVFARIAAAMGKIGKGNAKKIFNK